MTRWMNGSWYAWSAQSWARKQRWKTSSTKPAPRELRDFQLNERQRLVLNRLLDGFEGKLTTSKWAKLAKCSHDTALRDILPLVERAILVRSPQAGRSASYELVRR